MQFYVKQQIYIHVFPVHYLMNPLNENLFFNTDFRHGILEFMFINRFVKEIYGLQTIGLADGIIIFSSKNNFKRSGRELLEYFKANHLRHLDV